MVASAVLICACVLQQRDVIGDRFEIIAIVHSETVIEPGTITPDMTLEQLEIVATEKGWSIVKADQLVVLVDARLNGWANQYETIYSPGPVLESRIQLVLKNF